MEENKMHNYEIMYIIDDKSEEKTIAIKKEFFEILTKNGGIITKEENVIRQFSQPLDYKVKGHYFIIWTKTSAVNIANFNRVFLIKQKQGEVFRKMVINLDNEPINKFKERRERPAPTNFIRRDGREMRPRRVHMNTEATSQQPEGQTSRHYDKEKNNHEEQSKQQSRNNDSVAE